MNPPHTVPKTFEGLDATICQQLVKILKLKRQFIDRELKNVNISRTQWQVLLWQHWCGPCSQQELLNYLDIDAAHLTRVLVSLEEKQWITRTTIDGDRRALSICITDYCKEHIIPLIEKTVQKKHAMMFQGVSGANKQQLIGLLNQLSANLDALLTCKEDA